MTSSHGLSSTDGQSMQSSSVPRLFEALDGSDGESGSLEAARAVLTRLSSSTDKTAYNSTNWSLQLDSDPYTSLLSGNISASSSAARKKPSKPKNNALDWLHKVLPEQSLFAQALDILQSPSSDADIAESLLEIFGFEGIENVSEAVNRRLEIVNQSTSSSGGRADGTTAPSSPSDSRSGMPLNGAPSPEIIKNAASNRRALVPTAQVQFSSAEELAEAKRARKAARYKGKAKAEGDGQRIDLEEWQRIREESLKSGPGALYSSSAALVADAEKYPNIYLAPGRAAASLLMAGHKLALPFGTTKIDRSEYEEITIPAPKPVPMRFNESLVPIADMDEWGRRTFKSYETLNRLQSIVYPIAYHTNENMLVCAPTGAGKTDVAALTILRCLSQHARLPLEPGEKASLPPASKYKIIYVAPLKALAAEITQKFAKRLGWAGVRVRELTGDMRLTKREIDETSIIVTTPEKWDVVTRKTGSSDSEVADKVRLLIIDEVHLLHDDRGAVIESIVARTLRQIESSQTMIRIVGLSATLPNYVDVADFLSVNRYRGLFYFDSSFRPVPLEQHFIGAKGKAGTVQNRNNIDNACFDKVSELVKAGHQVMVFVHSRKDTVKTAEMLRFRFQAEDLMDYLEPEDRGTFASFKRDLGASRNREMKELAGYGFGIHHAGMLRSDRTLSERMFEADVTKVLCCTATLAWGVNLPAYAVVIKGTSVYDSGKGSAVDLSILDVLQIFGRAGRPQYESQGVGYICTSHDKLDHYVSAMTQQHPIESKFIAGLVDSLNAEISLGTVANMDEGVRWLGYSYLYVRMRKNPLVYGMVADDVQQDPLLGNKRLQLIQSAAKRLAEIDMIRFDQDTGRLESTPLGRVAAKYYVRSASIEIFNRRFRAQMTEADILGLIASSVEFQQVQIRENELPELRTLLERVPCQIEGGITANTGKVNCLLQTYISRHFVEDFALVSDTAYIAQNATRIARALLEISLARKWATTSLVLLSISKSIERRMWSFSHPLSQFDLPGDLMLHVEEKAADIPLVEIGAMSDSEFGKIINLNDRLGGIATKAAREMPALEISHSVKPLANDLIKVTLRMRRGFDWNDNRHGKVEPFWVWIEDEAGLSILSMTRIAVRAATDMIVHDFFVPASLDAQSLSARALPDRWISDDEPYLISLSGLVLPPPPPANTQLLLLPLLNLEQAFADALMQGVYQREMATLDTIQTQTLHAMYHTQNNVFLAAPDSNSRSLMLELAIWRQLKHEAGSRVIVISSSKQVARATLLRMRRVFAATGIAIMLCTKQSECLALAHSDSHIAVVSPGAVESALLQDSNALSRTNLLVVQDAHALTIASENAIARMILSANEPMRIVGTSASLLDTSGIAGWLGVPIHCCYSFSPASRSSSLTTNVVPFSLPHSVALLRTMAKPAYAAIRTAAGGTIVFVPSRAQCSTTAMDLVALTGGGLEESLLSVPDESMEKYASMLSDSDLIEALLNGIAVCHEGLKADEQRLALQLFKSGVARVLVVPRESCYTLPVQASLVICLSAQYATYGDNDEREIRNYPLNDLLQMQRYAVPPDSASTAEFLVMCQPEQGELYKRFLMQGVPFESPIDGPGALADLLFDDLVEGRVKSRQDVVDYLSLTYAGQRVRVNPSYYGVDDIDGNAKSTTIGDRRVSRLVDLVIDQYESRCFVVLRGTAEFALTKLATVFVEFGLDLEDVREIQALSIDDMVRFSGVHYKPASARVDESKANGSSSTSAKDATNKPKKKNKYGSGGSLLDRFFRRLPKPLRDTIGAPEKTSSETAGGEKEEGAVSTPTDHDDLVWQARVLFGAFSIGRTPRDSGQLEEAQAALVKDLITGRQH